MRKEKENKKKKGFLKKSVAGVIAGALALSMAVGLMQPGLETQAAKVADLDTTTKYTESLGDGISTEYSGRVWTDKTVKKIDETSDDFEVTYSALSTSQSVTGSTNAPLDVVFIIDISGSMVNSNSGMTDANNRTYSRMKFTVDALNESIAKLMSMNEHNRVAVVTFSDNANTLLDLGRYAQRNATTPYFSVNRTTPLSEDDDDWEDYPDLYTDVQGKNRITTKLYGGTNIQQGFYEGMEILTTSDTTATINGKTVDRIPFVVMLSDGAPTYSVDNTSWWAPTGDEQNGNGRGHYYGNGMKAMMTATYMKAAINRNYTKNPVKLYTIGMGITGLTDDALNLANVTLNPAQYYNADNTMSRRIREAWDDSGYTYGDNERNDYYTHTNARYNIPSISVGPNGSFELRHPTQYDITSTGISSYVDKYYPADTAAQINDVFSTIVSEIAVSSPEVPTDVATGDPLNDGYVTYTDPIGKYMEVKGDTITIVHRGTEYTAVKGTSSTADGVTTTHYTCTDKVETYIHGEHSLSEIDIILTEDANGDQTLSVRIPAAMIPLRINTVVLNTNGTVKSHTNNGAAPIQFVYTVGLQDGLKKDGLLVSEPEGFTDAQLTAYQSYINSNKDTNGNVKFYTNLYTGTNIVDGDKAGDTTVEFKSSPTNPFYYMQSDMIIYTDEACTEPAKEIKNDDTLYYYKETFYNGMAVDSDTVIRTGAALNNNTELQQNEDGVWYRPAGTVRVNRMLEFLGHKEQNATGTAEDFYAPSYVGGGVFRIYHGNNGLLTVAATGNLEFTKTVTVADGLNDEEALKKDFTFTVTLKDADGKPLAGTYDYIVTDTAGGTVKSGSISSGQTLTMKHGQKAEIKNLPDGTTYTITEAAVPGFTTNVTGDTGTIDAGTTKVAAFTNHYTITTPLKFPTEGKLGGEKTLSGRHWEDDDTFTFIITSSNDAPLPDPNEVTIKGKDAAGNEKLAFDFGTIEYTLPGVYEYRIVEETPAMVGEESLPGVSYTREAYEVVVTVVDKGDGTLSASSVMTKVLDAVGNEISQPIDDNNASFTNTFSTASVTYGPVAIKTYHDKSGVKPLADRMFTFQMTPAEGYADAPMPEGTVNGVYTAHNVGEYISFGKMEFTQQHANQHERFVYELREVIPEDATDNGNGTFTYRGMTYDASVITVTVDVDLVDGNVKPTLTYTVERDGETETLATGEFTNTYNETPVEIGKETDYPVKGLKTFTGRKDNQWLDTDTFTFKLSAAADDKTGIKVTVNDVERELTTAEAASSDYAFVTLPAEVTVDKDDLTDVTNGIAGFEFEKIRFTKQGTYTFNMEEVIPEDAVDNGDGTYTYKGITYDAHVCTVTVVVEDKVSDTEPKDQPDGVLEVASVTYSDGTQASFENEYNTVFDDSTAVTVIGAKELTGRPLTENAFFFEIALENGSRAVPVIGTDEDLTDADQDGIYEDNDLTFLNNVTYTEAGTYVYYITEQRPEEATADNHYKVNGVTYDSSKYKVTVVVTDDNEGTLTASKTVEKLVAVNDGVEVYESVDTIVFKNKYETENATSTLAGITKVLDGKRADALKTGEFEFTISATPSEGVTLPSAPGYNDADGNVIFGVEEDADGNLDFANAKNYITFEKPGTYVVTIKEVEGEDSTITYDDNVLELTYHVEDDGNGNLVARVVGTSGNHEFKNIYSSTGTGQLEVTKNFTGRTWAEGESFTFIIEGHDPVTREAIANGIIELPAPDEVSKAVIARENEAGNLLDGNIENVTGITITNDGNVTHTTVNGENVDTKSVIISNIKFNEAGTYIFSVREVREAEYAIPGVDYDAVFKTITVTAVDNNAGTLTLSADPAGVTFTNHYDPTEDVLDGHGNLHVQKVIDGRDWTDTDAFTFTLTPNMEDSVTKDAFEEGNIVLSTGTGSDTITVTNVNKGYEHFGNITFKQAGRFEFIVTEDADNLPGGITVGTKSRIVVVKVTLTEDNVLLAVVDTADSENQALEFTNYYNPEDATLPCSTELQVQKVISGRDWKTGDSFTFTLAGYDEKTIAAIASKEILLPGTSKDAAGDAILSEVSTTIDLETEIGYFDDGNGEKDGNDVITFTKEEVYTFVIQEIAGTDEDLTYDSHKEIIEVTVTDNGNGNLVAEVTKNATEGYYTFTNVYEPDPVTLEIKGTKEMSGRDFLSTDGFEFTITAVTGGAPMPEVPYVRVRAEAGSAPLEFAFGSITYTEAGTYVYEIKETKGGLPGVTYDTTVWKVTVEVEDNSGQLEASVVYGTDAANTGVKFVNEYAPEEGTLEGKTNLKVNKVIDGRAWFTSDDFAFTLEADLNHANTKAAIDKGNIITLPEDTTLEIDSTNRTDAYFGDIVFKKEGEYQFLIKEVIPADADKISDMDYDLHTETVTVKVEDNKQGSLVATVIGEDKDYTFTNEYTPTDAIAEISGKKTLTGRTLGAEEFSFTIARAEGEPETTPLPNPVTVKNAADGTVSFGEIEFNEAGTYKYIITENATNVAGVQIDTSTWTATVTVIYNQGKGVYETSVTYAKEEGNEQSQFEFANTYTTNVTDPVPFEVVKSVESLAGSSYEMVGGEFEFTITPNGSNPESDPIDATTISNGADGTAVFANAQYTEAGVYVYTVKEVAGDAEGIAYDDTVYTITVTVTDNEAIAKLETSVEVLRDGEIVAEGLEGIKFKNQYGPGTVTLNGSTNLKIDKSFTGRKDDQWLDGDKFTFKLSADDKESTGIVVEVEGVEKELTTAEAAGAEYGYVNMSASTELEMSSANKDSAHFGDIVFSHVGTYTFLIEEIPGSAGGVGYDTHTMKVKVVVTDNQSGRLIAAAPIITGGGFDNTYSTKSTTATLKGTKELTGRKLDAEEFSFTINAAAGTPMPAETTVKNTVGVEDTPEKYVGNIEFAPIVYTAPGEYHYTITELVPEGATINPDGSYTKDGVTYDKVSVEVTVTVTDQNDGTLKAEVVYKEGASGTEFVFRNTYNANPTAPVDLTGNKKVEGHAYTLSEGDFEFKLTPAASNPAQDPLADGATVPNAADGTIVFMNDVVYTEPGVYVYDITEVNTGKVIPAMSYDSSVYQVTVTVTDENAQLVADVKVTKAGTEADIEFVNTYSPEATTAIISGQKEMVGKPLGNDKFTFELSAFDDETQEAIDDKYVVLPEDLSVENDQTGLFQFDAITFKHEGTYKFKVTEKVPADADKIPGVTYNPSGVEYVVTVEVAVGNESLSITDEEAEEFVLKNPEVEEEQPPVDGEEQPLVDGEEEQPPVDGEEQPPVDGEEQPLVDGEEQPPVDGEEQPPVDGEEQPPADGEEQPPVDGEEQPPVDGEEQPPVDEDEPAVEEDTLLAKLSKIIPLRFIMTGTTPEENEPAPQSTTDKLEASVTVTKVGSDTPTEIVFVNEYKAEPAVFEASTTIKGTKLLTGRDMKELTDGEFKVVLEDWNKNQYIANIAGNGSFAYGTFVFSKVGTYYFTLTEMNTSVPGVTYDSDSYTVKVDVVDDYSGQLKATATIYDKDGVEVQTGEDIVFENTYKAAPTSAQISAAKDLSGRKLRDGEFEFILSPVENAPMPEGKETLTAKNDEEGVAVFDEIEFKEAGTFKYAVTEKNTGVSGVTFDTAVYNVTVTVTDDGNGYLVAEVASDADIVFENTYKAAPTSVTITATKKLTGRTLKAGEFTFYLKDAEGEIVRTATNDANGLVTFEAIEYTEVPEGGKAVYTVTESADKKLSHVTYDQTTYNVTVTLTDDGNGELAATVETTNAVTGEAVEEIVFTNKYNKPSDPDDEPEEEPEDDEPEYYPAPQQPTGSTGVNTGDSANIGGLLGLLAIAVAGFAGITVYRRKKH